MTRVEAEQEERLPPWRIEVDRDGDIIVTDGLLALLYRDHPQALKALASVSTRWPHGTREGSPGELRRAHERGFRRGQVLGVAVGTMLGVILSTIISYASLAWWGL